MRAHNLYTGALLTVAKINCCGELKSLLTKRNIRAESSLHRSLQNPRPQPCISTCRIPLSPAFCQAFLVQVMAFCKVVCVAVMLISCMFVQISLSSVAYWQLLDIRWPKRCPLYGYVRIKRLQAATLLRSTAIIVALILHICKNFFL